MFIVHVAEWCVEALVLGLAFFFASLGMFIFVMLLSLAKRWVEELLVGDEING